MDYDDVVDMMICYLIIFVSTGAIDWFLLSVQDSGLIEDVDGIDGPPWTPDRVREWIVYGLSIFVIAYVTYDWYIMMLILDR
jgi:hypothetical protein